MSYKDAIKKFLFKEFTLVDNVDKTTMEIVENRIKLSYYEIQVIVERAMKRSIMNHTTEVETKDIYKDFAIAMRMNLRFNTEQ